MKLTNKRHDYINKTVHEVVIARPEYITIEDLNVSGMMKNRHLSRAIAESEFYYFRALLERKCIEYGIELQIAYRYYASSKTCSRCGNIKRDLKLKDRVYECTECGLVIDRDYNAALNLRSCKKISTVGISVAGRTAWREVKPLDCRTSLSSIARKGTGRTRNNRKSESNTFYVAEYRK